MGQPVFVMTHVPEIGFFELVNQAISNRHRLVGIQCAPVLKLNAGTNLLLESPVTDDVSGSDSTIPGHKHAACTARALCSYCKLSSTVLEDPVQSLRYE